MEPALPLDHGSVRPSDAPVQVELVGLLGFRDERAAHRPFGVVPLDHRAPRVAARVRGVVPGAGAHQRPIEELRARVVRVGVGVEVVDEREFSRDDGQAPRRGGPGRLVRPVVDLFSLAAEAEHLADEQARGRHDGRRVADPVDLPVRLAGDAQRAADAAAAAELGVQVHLGPRDEPHTHEQRRGDRHRLLRVRLQAVLPGVRGREARVSLLDHRRLVVQGVAGRSLDIGRWRWTQPSRRRSPMGVAPQHVGASGRRQRTN